MAFAWGGVAAALAFAITPVLGLDLKGGTRVPLRAPDGTDPEVLQNARGPQAGGIQISVLDTTDPAAVGRVLDRRDQGGVLVVLL